jgi:hypothetical protein
MCNLQVYVDDATGRLMELRFTPCGAKAGGAGPLAV